MLHSFFKACSTVLIISILLRVVSWKAILDALSSTALAWLLPMYGMMIVGRTLEAIQMQVILGKVGYRLRLGRIFMANTLSAFYSFILPGDMLAGIAKWANLSAATGNKAVILNAIVYNRLVLIIHPLVIGVFALAWENPFHSSILPGALIIMIILALAIVVCIFHPSYGVITDKIIRKISKPLPNVINRRVEKILKSITEFRYFRLRDHFNIYSIGFFILLIRLIIFALASTAVGIQIPFYTLAWIMALLTSSRQLPITFSNLGVREGILMAVLSPYGVEVESSFALGLIMFSNQILIGFIGFLYHISLIFGMAQWKLNDRKTQKNTFTKSREI
jgi:uncharacterized membrane protein YbhN (UPF0104 family)